MNMKITDQHALRVICDFPGRTRERNERLRGHIGVSNSDSTSGWTIGPPDDNEYAVEPVGVDSIKPSDTASVRCCPSTYASMMLRCGLRPLYKATSFMTCHPEKESQ